MIGKVIDLLNSDEFYGVSNRVEIAKGKHSTIVTWTGLYKNLKRRVKWLKK